MSVGLLKPNSEKPFSLEHSVLEILKENVVCDTCQWILWQKYKQSGNLTQTVCQQRVGNQFKGQNSFWTGTRYKMNE